MSVVVRMEMPKSCYVCPCLDDYGDYPRCRISNEQRGYNFPIHEKRMPNCPIICSLPEGHGRLIDADAAYKAACEGADNWDGGCSPYRDDCIREEMDKVPTASPWHRVEEPPKQNGAYVVWWNYKGTSYWFRGVFFDGRWLFEPGTPKPDYWMPIEPPKEDA